MGGMRWWMPVAVVAAAMWIVGALGCAARVDPNVATMVGGGGFLDSLSAIAGHAPRAVRSNDELGSKASYDTDSDVVRLMPSRDRIRDAMRAKVGAGDALRTEIDRGVGVAAVMLDLLDEPMSARRTVAAHEWGHVADRADPGLRPRFLALNTMSPMAADTGAGLSAETFADAFSAAIAKVFPDMGSRTHAYASSDWLINGAQQAFVDSLVRDGLDRLVK